MLLQHRLYGIEFTPNRLDIKHNLSCNRTGFEIAFDSVMANPKDIGVGVYRILDDMNIGHHSDAAYELEELVKFGDHNTTDFIRDYLAGFSHGRSYIDMSNNSLGKFSAVSAYLASKRAHVTLGFDDESLDAIFAHGDFPILDPDNEGQPYSMRDLLYTNKAEIVNGVLMLGTHLSVKFRIDGNIQYSEGTCRTIANLFNEICKIGYHAIEELMFKEKQNEVANQVRLFVEKAAENPYQESAGDIPNFYM